MSYVKLGIRDSEHALELARQGLSMDPVNAEKLWRDIDFEVSLQVGLAYQKLPVEYPVNEQVDLFSLFYKRWEWYSAYGIDPEDYTDVIERARPLIAAILNGSVTMLEELEGLEEFIAYARERYHFLRHSPKYRGGLDDDPIGH